MNLSVIELAYLAGIIDGEGSIQLVKNNKGSYTTRITVSNTDLRLIHWLMYSLGGSYYEQKKHNKNYKPTYHWVLSSKHTHNILLKVLPYLKLKKEQANILIKHKDTCYNKQQRWRLSDLEKEIIIVTKDLLYLDIKVLNQRGVEQY